MEHLNKENLLLINGGSSFSTFGKAFLISIINVLNLVIGRRYV